MEGRWEESQALLEEGIRIANSHHDSQCARCTERFPLSVRFYAINRPRCSS